MLEGASSAGLVGRFREIVSCWEGSQEVTGADRILVAGHSRLPRGTSVANTVESFGLTLDVELRHGVILHADSTLATKQARDFLASLLVGYSLIDGVEEAVAEVERRYAGRSTKAITAALRDAQTVLLGRLGISSGDS